MQRPVDTITRRAKEAWQKPEVRRRVKWGALFLLIINVIGIFSAGFFATKPNEVSAAITPTYVGASAIGFSTGADLNATLPTYQSGDILLLTILIKDSDDAVTVSGYTSLGSYNGSLGKRRFWFYKRATSSESGPLVDKSTSTGETYVKMYSFRNAYEVGNPWEVVSNVMGGNGDPAPITGITTLTAKSLVIGSIIGDDNNNGYVTWTATNPATLTDVYDETNDGADAMFDIGYAERTTAGATGNISADFSAGNPLGWAAISLALKPSAPPPTLTIHQPSTSVVMPDDHSNYYINYSLADTDDVVTANFYYDTNNTGYDGVYINGGGEGANQDLLFSDVSGKLTPGIPYYIYGVVSDGVSTVQQYSTGTVTVNDAPTLSLSRPVSGNTNVSGNYIIYYTMIDTDNVVTAAFYYDTNTDMSGGTAIAACASAPEGTNNSCTFDTSILPPNTPCYIYAVTSGDAVNAPVSAIGPGTITRLQANANPNAPSSLTQKTSPGDVSISESSWTADSTPSLGFTLSDSDVSDTVKYQAQIDNSSSAFSSLIIDYTHGSLLANPSTPSFTIGSYGGGTCSGSCPATLSDSATGYWWRVRTIDNSGATSGWTTFGVLATLDFKVDATAPTGGTVKDGAAADQDWNDGSLTQILGNWTGTTPDAGVSGLLKYEYSIRRQSDGWYWNGSTWQAGESWTDNGTVTTFTKNTMNLSTGVNYQIYLKTTDNAGNAATINSNGQQVAPTLSYSVDSNSVVFSDLNNLNNWTDTKTTTVTTSTNAVNGYSIKAYVSDSLRSLMDVTQFIANFVGTWVSPQNWANFCQNDSGDCGFGYTSNDTTIQGSNKFGTGNLFAAYSQAAPGDVVADHTELIDGSTGAVSNEQFTITHKVSVPASQTASKYQANAYFIVIANF